MYCTCREQCKLESFIKKHKTIKKNHGAFKAGYFRCRKCEFYIKEFSYCPCCGTRLATGPRNAKFKRLLKMDVGRY